MVRNWGQHEFFWVGQSEGSCGAIVETLFYLMNFVLRLLNFFLQTKLQKW
jgi:hypothetical protein